MSIPVDHPQSNGMFGVVQTITRWLRYEALMYLSQAWSSSTKMFLEKQYSLHMYGIDLGDQEEKYHVYKLKVIQLIRICKPYKDFKVGGVKITNLKITQMTQISMTRNESNNGNDVLKIDGNKPGRLIMTNSMTRMTNGYQHYDQQ